MSSWGGARTPSSGTFCFNLLQFHCCCQLIPPPITIAVNDSSTLLFTITFVGTITFISVSSSSHPLLSSLSWLVHYVCLCFIWFPLLIIKLFIPRSLLSVRWVLMHLDSCSVLRHVFRVVSELNRRIFPPSDDMLKTDITMKFLQDLHCMELIWR